MICKRRVILFQISLIYFRYGETTYTASQLSKEINKVPLLLQNLAEPPKKQTEMKKMKIWLKIGSLKKCGFYGGLTPEGLVITYPPK